MAKKIKFTKNTFKKIGAVFLAGALSLGAIFGIAKLSEALDTETKTVHLSYSVGSLNDSGKFAEDNGSIYTKEAFECQGLKITPDFDSQVSYKVFYYDMNECFLESTSSMTEFYEGAPIIAKYARIEITPLEEDKVSWYETAKYGAQLKVEVNKEQSFLITNIIDNGFDKLDNLAIYNSFGTGGFYDDDFRVDSNESAGFHFLTPISIDKKHNFVILKVKADSIDEEIIINETKYNSVAIIFNNGDELISLSNNTYIKDGFAYICGNVEKVEKVSARITADDIDIVGIYLV